MAHPHVLGEGEVGEEHRLARGLHLGLAVLGLAGVDHRPAGEVGEELMAVADAEDGNPGLDDAGIDPVGVGGVHRGRSPGEDEPGGTPGPHLGGGDVTSHDLRVDVGLPHPAGDQLGVLGPEVDDQDRLPGGAAHPIPTRWLRCSALPSVWSEGAIMTSAFWNSLTSE